ncbi:MAG: hypothetical protein R3C18_23720 [Planctomycetaceae bacterium]
MSLIQCPKCRISYSHMLHACPACQTPGPSLSDDIDLTQCKEAASIMLGQGKPVREVERFLVQRYKLTHNEAHRIVRSAKHKDSEINLGYIVSRMFLVSIILIILRYVILLFLICIGG